jgi:GPH family glycoside/pentoside/hexuronide:cation symporter
MQEVFPNVRRGDRLTGVHQPGTGAVFLLNGRPLATIADEEFARRFFGIWLSPQTSDTRLRKALTLAAGDPLMASAATDPPQVLPLAQGWRYGLLGLPLAFVALPLYVVLPNHYAREFGVPLAALGGVLLAARLLDACIDPVIGRCLRPAVCPLGRCGAAGRGHRGGAAGGRFRPALFSGGAGHAALLAWVAGVLVITYAAYSAAERGAPVLGRDAGWRRRPTAAASSPGARGSGWPVWCWPRCCRCWPGLGATLAGLLRRAGRRDGWPGAARCGPRSAGPQTVTGPLAPLAPAGLPPPARRVRAQRHCQRGAGHAGAVLRAGPAAGGPAIESGVAGGVLPVRGRVDPGLAAAGGAHRAGAQLAVRHPDGGVRLCRRATAGRWRHGAFLVVCALSGLALGTDLALPGALLAGVIAQAGDRGRAEGAYFGWWNFATKLNLALAAGLALPLLGWFGYAPGARDAAALQALTIAYCLLPCLLKLAAARAVPAPSVTSRAGPPHHEPQNTCSARPPRTAMLLADAGLAGCASQQIGTTATRSRCSTCASTSTARWTRTASSPTAPAPCQRRFTVVMECRWQGDEGVLDEAFTYSDGTPERRVWRLTRLADGRYTGRADDVVGVAQGGQSGNAAALDLHAGPAGGRHASTRCSSTTGCSDRRARDAQQGAHEQVRHPPGRGHLVLHQTLTSLDPNHPMALNPR